MRSIGRKNIRLVQKITAEESKKGFKSIEERVIERLPEELWDTWEGAHQEICRIIDEAVMSDEGR